MILRENALTFKGPIFHSTDKPCLCHKRSANALGPIDKRLRRRRSPRLPLACRCWGNAHDVVGSNASGSFSHSLVPCPDRALDARRRARSCMPQWVRRCEASHIQQQSLVHESRHSEGLVHLRDQVESARGDLSRTLVTAYAGLGAVAVGVSISSIAIRPTSDEREYQNSQHEGKTTAFR